MVVNTSKQIQLFGYIFLYDKTKPNGTPRKVMDISLAKKYGWKPKTKIENAILKTYENYVLLKKT